MSTLSVDGAACARVHLSVTADDLGYAHDRDAVIVRPTAGTIARALHAPPTTCDANLVCAYVLCTHSIVRVCQVNAHG